MLEELNDLGRLIDQAFLADVTGHLVNLKELLAHYRDAQDYQVNTMNQ
jgi:hypothetical protein